MTEEQITGYPHIDKPYSKWYDEEQKKAQCYDMSLTDYVREKNRGRENAIGRSYYGKEETFQEIFDKQDEAAKVFSQLGVKKEERIACLMPNIPEAGDVWLGNVQLGAVSDFIDPRPDSINLEDDAKKKLEIFKEEKINYIFALEQSYLYTIRPIEDELKDMGVQKIITVSASDSMNFSGKLSYLKDQIVYNKLRNANLKMQKTSLKNYQKLNGYQVIHRALKQEQEMKNAYEEAIKNTKLEVLSYRDLVKDCQNSSFKKIYEKDSLQYIGHTSGTTGNRPKPITATNEQAISAVDQALRGKVGFLEGEKVLHVLPFFAPFGAYTNYILNMVAGCTNIDVPEFVISEFGYLIKKYKPNGAMGTPSWFTALPDYKYLRPTDIKQLNKLVYGGATMNAEDEKRLLNWAKHIVLEKGYGRSEDFGADTYARGGYNKPSCMGIPLPDTTFAIIDPSITDELVPLKFEEGMETLSGELAISNPATTSGKLDGKTIVEHYQMDGADYTRTRDIVYMDRDGVFFHEDRKDRSFARHDGYKVMPYEIEKVILENENIRYACITPYFSDKDRGIMPICHVVPNHLELTSKEKIAIVEEIVYKQILGNSDMVSRQVPIKFNFRESLPISKGGKMDFRALEKEDLPGDEINVDLIESNLNIDRIEIYQNKKEKKYIKK